MTKTYKFFVKESEVMPYSPLNHTGTVNRRLIGPNETGSENLEVLAWCRQQVTWRAAAQPPRHRPSLLRDRGTRRG